MLAVFISFLILNNLLNGENQIKLGISIYKSLNNESDYLGMAKKVMKVKISNKDKEIKCFI